MTTPESGPQEPSGEKSDLQSQLELLKDILDINERLEGLKNLVPSFSKEIDQYVEALKEGATEPFNWKTDQVVSSIETKAQESAELLEDEVREIHRVLVSIRNDVS